MKKLSNFIKESYTLSNDHDSLYNDVVIIFRNWLDDADDRYEQINDIKMFINDDNDMVYDCIIDQLKNEYDYDVENIDNDELYDILKSAAQHVINKR